jgi:putative ABC transport system ATP-binding protein
MSTTLFPTPLIAINSVSKQYRLGQAEVHALEKVSLKVDKGEFMALAGSSGSGKTTLLNLIGAIDIPTHGEILIEGIPLQSLTSDELARFRRKKIGYIFQTFNLIPTLTARENVEYPLVLLGVSAAERKVRALQHLKRVGLEDRADRRPNQLSGGQRQRVAIARAMVKNPTLVLADEPTANLDKKTAVEILDLMQKLNQEEGTTFVFSTHDPLILSRATRVFWLGQEEKQITALRVVGG